MHRICYLLLLLPFLAFAQPSLWLTAGPSVNHQTHWSISGRNLIKEGEFEVSPALGWQFQLGADFDIADNWTFETGLGFRKWNIRDKNYGPLTFNQRDDIGGFYQDTVDIDLRWRSGIGVTAFQFAIRRKLIDNANWKMDIGGQFGLSWVILSTSKLLNRDELYAAADEVDPDLFPVASRGNNNSGAWFNFRSTPHFSFGLTMVNDFPINDKLNLRVKPGFLL